MGLFSRGRKTYDPQTEAQLATTGALEAFQGVIGQLHVANSFFDDAIGDAHVAAAYHEDEATFHAGAAKAQVALAKEHSAAVAKNQGVIERLTALLEG